MSFLGEGYIMCGFMPVLGLKADTGWCLRNFAMMSPWPSANRDRAPKKRTKLCLDIFMSTQPHSRAGTRAQGENWQQKPQLSHHQGQRCSQEEPWLTLADTMPSTKGKSTMIPAPVLRQSHRYPPLHLVRTSSDQHRGCFCSPLSPLPMQSPRVMPLVRGKML